MPTAIAAQSESSGRSPAVSFTLSVVCVVEWELRARQTTTPLPWAAGIPVMFLRQPDGGPTAVVVGEQTSPGASPRPAEPAVDF